MAADLTTHETKAIRMMVLYRLRAEGQLSGLSDIALGEAFDVDRITIWKDKRALKRADQLYARIMAKAPWGDRVTVAEAAQQLTCDPETIRCLIRDGLLRADKRAGKWRIPTAEIERLKR